MDEIMGVTSVDIRESTLTPRASIAGATLDDKYSKVSGRIYISGVHALVRLPLVQRLRDLAEGLNTGGFISGYRGSPLALYDEALWKAQAHLDAHHVKFQPGVNEDLAATAVWGSQQLTLLGDAAYDGVFALWYGKGPGVDRCGDVFKHMNYAGTSRHGGVLLVAADDHEGHSSTLPHQSEHAFSAAMIPVLYPSNVEDYVTLGLHGWAMSRFSGCAVGFKAVADTVESSATIDADPFGTTTLFPTDFVMPPGGLNARLFKDTVAVRGRAQEALMHDYKIFAALAYARLNKLNRVTIDSPRARFGIVASGKSYVDVVEALDELGIDETVAQQIGIRLFKVSMPWPLEPQGVRAFAEGLEEILVVEEKRQIVEYQLKEQLYHWRDDVRPRVIGKFDERGEWTTPRGEWLLSAKEDFSVAKIAQVIARRIARFHSSENISDRLRFLEEKEAALARAFKAPPRPPYYCSGCPHNSSTKVPAGSMALAGIGCHIMAPSIFPEHNRTITHMGGEGAPWIGAAPFSKVPHVFANLGDGTYFHSGSLAIRAAVAANVNITYKLLYNDAVAMTGGQPIQGSIRQAAWQLFAEGVKRIAIVTEDMERYAAAKEFPGITTFDDRRDFMKIQRELRDTEGVTVLIFDQVCAAEKRRRRKKGQFPDPDKRLFINDAVCEGCGDCGEQSNCVSILPLETSTGRKRIIDQSNCNKDFSCAKGFCPSFVTVKGGKIRNRAVGRASEPKDLGLLPPVRIPSCAETYNILINGIGGTGVITIGALLGMAAHIEGKSVSVLDMTGMSQKNGAVTSHVRVSEKPRDYPARIPSGEADLILGCDILTSGARDAVSKAQAGRTYAVVNQHQQPTGAFTKNPDWQFPGEEMVQVIRDAVGERAIFIDATAIATALLGDSIAANLFMLGLSYQRGLIPIGEVAINRAIKLNGIAVAANKKAFEWGRHAAVDEAKVRSIALPNNATIQMFPPSLDQEIHDRVRELTSYQNAAYARQYLDLVARVRATEQRLAKGTRLTSAVSRYFFKLMAYKDEYEVARLYTDGRFKERLAAQFDGEVSLRFNLAPPLFAKRDAEGHLIKREYGPWIWHAFRVLTKLKFLRGTLFDPFGYTAERRIERQLIAEYRGDVEKLLEHLNETNVAEAAELASWPEHVRGYGHVKDASLSALRTQRNSKHTREQAPVLDRRTG
jgi:indolepyruvate ferredoxin oxidoreductase